MGYDVRMTESRFFLPQHHERAALTALRAFARRAGTGEMLKEILVELGWSPTFDDDGNIIRLAPRYESVSERDEMALETLVPFVEIGSYLQMQGHDGEMWRWVFTGSKVKRVTGHIVFEED